MIDLETTQERLEEMGPDWTFSIERDGAFVCFGRANEFLDQLLSLAPPEHAVTYTVKWWRNS